MVKKKSKKPSKAEIEKLRNALNAASKEFFASYGKNYDFLLVGPPGTGTGKGKGTLMVGPPGPRPPPKLEVSILNLSSY